MSALLTPEVCDRLRLTKDVALAVFVADADNTDAYAAAWRAFDRAEVFVKEYDRRFEAQEDAAEIALGTPCPESVQSLTAEVARLTAESADRLAKLTNARAEIVNLRRLWVSRENRGFKGRVGRAGL
jgi:hypothetical protein